MKAVAAPCSLFVSTKGGYVSVPVVGRFVCRSQDIWGESHQHRKQHQHSFVADTAFFLTGPLHNLYLLLYLCVFKYSYEK